MHSILGRGSFSTNDSISEVWHGSDQPVALLRHYWAFSSSVLLDRLFLIFLLKISHRFHMGFRSGMLAGQSSTVISWSANHLEVVLALWAGAKVLLEKEISISIKRVSRWKHTVLQNLLVDSCIDFGLHKTQWTNTSRHHDTPNHHWLRKLHTGLQAAWILCLSSLLPDSRPWFPNEMQNLLLSEKRTLDHWATVQFFFLLSPGKTPASVHSLWSSPKCFNLRCLTVFSSLRSSLLLVQLFLPNFFQSTLHLICFDTALCEQPPLSVMTFCVEGVNDCLLNMPSQQLSPLLWFQRTRHTQNLYCRDDQ